MISQKRFISIGGRSSRPGGGSAHSKMSIKQASSIPSAPGSVGRVTSRGLPPVFRPLSSVTQPQMRLRASSGKWKHIDTSFADLQGISDLVITSVDKVKNQTAIEVSEELIKVCKVYQTENPIANFSNHDLASNSGPEQDSINNYTLKRRQWFAIVRAFYHGRESLWSTDGAPVERLYSLLTHLTYANNRRVSVAAPWEDEPLESYKELPLQNLVQLLSNSMRAQKISLSTCSPGMIVSCLAMGLHYGVIFGDADASPEEAVCRLIADASGNLTPSTALEMLRMVCNHCNSNEDASLTVQRIAKFLVIPSGVGEAEHREGFHNFFRVLSASSFGSPFEHLAIDDLNAFLRFVAAVQNKFPQYFGEGTSSLRVHIISALSIVKQTLNGPRTIRDPEGLNPLSSFENNLRLAHPDIHPHLKLRKTHIEGARDGSITQKGLASLLSSYKAVLETQKTAFRFSSVGNVLLEKHIHQQLAVDAECAPGHFISALSLAFERYGTGAHPKICELLRGLDRSLSKAALRNASAAQCITMFEMCSKANYCPANCCVVEERIIRCSLTPIDIVRISEARANLGRGSVSFYHSLANILLTSESPLDNSIWIRFAYACVRALDPTEASSLVYRLLDEYTMPTPLEIPGELGLHCAHIIFVARGEFNELIDPLSDTKANAICDYIVKFIGEAPKLVDIVAAFVTISRMMTSYPESVLEYLSKIAVSNSELDASSDIPFIHCVLTLAALPNSPNLTLTAEALQKKIEFDLSKCQLETIDLNSSEAVDLARAACVLLSVSPNSSQALRVVVGLLQRVDGMTGTLDGIPDLIECLSEAEKLLKLSGLWEEAEKHFELQSPN